MKGKRYALVCAGIGVCLLGVMILAVNLGAVNLRPSWIFKIIANEIFGRELFAAEWKPHLVSIVWNLRLPKVIAAAFIGASLSLCGVFMQALTRNPLAEPFVLGVSSGASTGAVAAILMGGLPLLGTFSLQFGAFAGAIIASMLVFAFSGGGNGTSRLALTGMAISAVFAALTNLLIFISPDTHKINSAVFWMIGSLAGVTWARLPPIVMVFCAGLCAGLLTRRSLDIMLTGEERAHTLGVDTKMLRRILIVISSLLAGVAVSISGVIGFVGLVIPHIGRTLFGPVHGKLIAPICLLGAAFMVCADMLARVLAKPEEMPAGIITALIGAPFFLHLLRTGFYKFGD
ncbi:MAG: iron ABC transporter permease [Spirochaetaceae bacterium]|jgi:iron complex transport system permease protein|nr:iron ABC transporter permease [Spirochaetaceae bacterium]